MDKVKHSSKMMIAMMMCIWDVDLFLGKRREMIIVGSIMGVRRGGQEGALAGQNSKFLTFFEETSIFLCAF